MSDTGNERYALAGRGLVPAATPTAAARAGWLPAAARTRVATLVPRAPSPELPLQPWQAQPRDSHSDELAGNVPHRPSQLERDVDLPGVIAAPHGGEPSGDPGDSRRTSAPSAVGEGRQQKALGPGRSSSAASEAADPGPAIPPAPALRLGPSAERLGSTRSRASPLAAHAPETTTDHRFPRAAAAVPTQDLPIETPRPPAVASSPRSDDEPPAASSPPVRNTTPAEDGRPATSVPRGLRLAPEAARQPAAQSRGSATPAPAHEHAQRELPALPQFAAPRSARPAPVPAAVTRRPERPDLAWLLASGPPASRSVHIDRLDVVAPVPTARPPAAPVPAAARAVTAADAARTPAQTVRAFRNPWAGVHARRD